MSCSKKTRNTPSAVSAPAASVSAPADTAGTAASAFADVPMRRYPHPIPAACDPYYCQSMDQADAGQSWACQGCAQRAFLARQLRRQQILLEEIYALLLRSLPHEPAPAGPEEMDGYKM